MVHSQYSRLNLLFVFIDGTVSIISIEPTFELDFPLNINWKWNVFESRIRLVLSAAGQAGVNTNRVGCLLPGLQ